MVFSLLRLALYLFFIALIGRLVLDWVQALAREWRPTGPVLVAAEVVYTVTDPHADSNLYCYRHNSANANTNSFFYADSNANCNRDADTQTGDAWKYFNSITSRD